MEGKPVKNSALVTRSLRRARRHARMPSTTATREPAALQVFLFRAESFLGAQVFDVGSPVTIGRSTASELLLHGDTVSRAHARLSVENGQVYVEDLGSANGTYVNRVCVQAKSVVTPTDAIHVGHYTIKVRALRAAARPQLIDPADTERITRVEAVFTLETDSRREAAIDLSGGFDRRLYDDAIRRATGGEGINTPLDVPADLAKKPSDGEGSVSDTEASEARPMPEAQSKAEPRAKTRAGERSERSVAARLRDLDELIASLDAREDVDRRAQETMDGFLGRAVDAAIPVSWAESLAKHAGSAIDKQTVEKIRQMSTTQFARDLVSQLAVEGQVMPEQKPAPKTSVDPLPPEMDPEQEATEQLAPSDPIARLPAAAPKTAAQQALVEDSPTAPSTSTPAVAKSPTPAKGVPVAPAAKPEATRAIAEARAEAAGIRGARRAPLEVVPPPSGAKSAKAESRLSQSSSPPPLPRIGTVPRAPLSEAATDRAEDETPIALVNPKRPAPVAPVVAPAAQVAPRGRSLMIEEPSLPRSSAEAPRFAGLLSSASADLRAQPALSARSKRHEAGLITPSSLQVGVAPASPLPAKRDDDLDDVWAREQKPARAPEPKPAPKAPAAKAPAPKAPAAAQAPARPATAAPRDASRSAERPGIFEAVEITARSRGALVDIAVLRKEGEQYVLGHRTPQGRIAPAAAHAGLRMLRINDDRTVDLVFPSEVGGHLVRGKETVMFNELTEGRKYSCLRLEMRDIATLILGEGQGAISYHIRFIRRSTSMRAGR